MSICFSNSTWDRNDRVDSKRGYSVCRGCNSENLVSTLDLGNQPLPAEYGRTPDEVLDTFPLHLRICQDCGLGQLGEYVLPERIFHNTYPYLSSASATWLRHAKQYAAYMQDTLYLDAESLVVELASNDGYLLSEFLKLNVPVQELNPLNVAPLRNALGFRQLWNFSELSKPRAS